MGRTLVSEALSVGDLVRIGRGRKEYRFRGVGSGAGGVWVDLYGPIGTGKARFRAVPLDTDLRRVRKRRSRP